MSQTLHLIINHCVKPLKIPQRVFAIECHTLAKVVEIRALNVTHVVFTQREISVSPVVCAQSADCPKFQQALFIFTKILSIVKTAPRLYILLFFFLQSVLYKRGLVGFARIRPVTFSGQPLLPLVFTIQLKMNCLSEIVVRCVWQLFAILLCQHSTFLLSNHFNHFLLKVRLNRPMKNIILVNI